MKKIYPLIFVLFVILSGLVNASGQAEAGRTYKVYTYTLIGSNDTSGRGNLSPRLSNAVDEMKRNFGYSNYRLLSTQFQLIKKNGNIAYKSVLKSSEISGETGMPVFADWSFQDFSDENRRPGFKSFRFNMRFPFKMTVAGKDGGSPGVYNYEPLGLSAQNIDFAVGKPVLFASLPVDIADKTLFFLVHLEESE
jgi:hypothetical protein